MIKRFLNMRFVILIVLFFLTIAFALPDSHHHLFGKCLGKTPCTACMTCEYCKHCNEGGGTCGVCKKPAKP